MDGKIKKVRVTFVGGSTKDYTLEAWLLIVKKAESKKGAVNLQSFFDEDSKEFLNSLNIRNICFVDPIK